jgi:electron transport complex protein RnfB
MTISVKDIDALLPQTQCGECGFAGCMPYAEALAGGSTSINKCPPGGQKTVKALAQLLGINAIPYLNMQQRPAALASIRENECIGCTKCIQACPVDAIAGAAKLMHVIINQECTGCGLCIEPCPVDCIDLLPLEEPTYDPALARQRFQAKKIRLLKEEQAKQQLYREKKRLSAKMGEQTEMLAKQNYITEALMRAKAKKQL